MSATTTQAVEAGHYAHECFDVYSKEVLENRMLPHAFDGLKPVLILPLIGSAIVGLLMYYVVGEPVAMVLAVNCAPQPMRP